MNKARLALLVVCLLLAACSDRAAGDPGEMVERYLQAKAAGDGDAIRRLLCREMERDYERERRSFEGVSEARLVGMNCRQSGQESIVRCQGKIVATYGAEQTAFPLSSYRVVWEDAEWKWCGEAP